MSTGRSKNRAINGIMIWLLLVTYVCFVVAFAYLFVTNVLPFLRKHLEKTSQTTLQYPQWAVSYTHLTLPTKA